MRTALPSFRSKASQLQNQVQGRVGYAIHKGSPKTKAGAIGKDLGSWLRISAMDAGEEVSDHGTGQVLTINKLLSEMQWAEELNIAEALGQEPAKVKWGTAADKKAPFAAATSIPIRILGFDHLVQTSAGSGENYHRWVYDQVLEWARAKVFNASGQMLAMTDPHGEWLLSERLGAEVVHYDRGDKPVEVVRNTAEDSVHYNDKLPLGIECHEYNGKLYTWSWSGTLQVVIPEFNQRAGLLAHGKFTTTSKYDITNLTEELVQIIVGAYPMPLKHIPLQLFRVQEKIASVQFDVKKHIDERRERKQSSSAWLVHIRMEANLVNKMFALKEQQEAKMLDAWIAGELESPEGKLQRINDELFGEEIDTQKVIAERSAVNQPDQIEEGNRILSGYAQAEVISATEVAQVVVATDAGVMDRAPIDSAPETTIDVDPAEKQPEIVDAVSPEDVATAMDDAADVSEDKSQEVITDESESTLDDLLPFALEVRKTSADAFPGKAAELLSSIIAKNKLPAGSKALGLKTNSYKTEQGRVDSYVLLLLYADELERSGEVNKSAEYAQATLEEALAKLKVLEKQAG